MKNYLIAILLVLSLFAGMQLSKWSHPNDEEVSEEKKTTIRDINLKHVEDSLLQATLKMYQNHSLFLDSIIIVLKKEQEEVKRSLAKSRKKLKEQDEEHERKMKDIRKLNQRSSPRMANYQTRQWHSNSNRVNAIPQRQHAPKNSLRSNRPRKQID